MKVKGFHSEPKREKDNHNEASKRATTAVGITAIGPELSLRKILAPLPRTQRPDLCTPTLPLVGLNDPSTLKLFMRRGASTACSTSMVEPLDGVATPPACLSTHL
jgi:hypothetical protein